MEDHMGHGNCIHPVQPGQGKLHPPFQGCAEAHDRLSSFWQLHGHKLEFRDRSHMHEHSRPHVQSDGGNRICGVLPGQAMMRAQAESVRLAGFR